MNLPEKNVLQRIKSGDENAFQLLFEKYYTSLFYYAVKFVESEQARDVVHDVFFAFWENRQRIVISTSLNAYLFQMVRNKSLQFLEKQKVRQKYAQQQELLLKMEEVNYYEESQGARSIIEKELDEQLNNALAKLPQRCYEVFHMSRVNGLRNAEIAEELSITVKAVEKQMTKALKILRAELKDYLPLFLYFIHMGGKLFH